MQSSMQYDWADREPSLVRAPLGREEGNRCRREPLRILLLPPLVSYASISSPLPATGAAPYNSPSRFLPFIDSPLSLFFPSLTIPLSLIYVYYQ